MTVYELLKSNPQKYGPLIKDRKALGCCEKEYLALLQLYIPLTDDVLYWFGDTQNKEFLTSDWCKLCYKYKDNDNIIPLFSWIHCIRTVIQLLPITDMQFVSMLTKSNVDSFDEAYIKSIPNIKKETIDILLGLLDDKVYIVYQLLCFIEPYCLVKIKPSKLMDVHQLIKDTVLNGKRVKSIRQLRKMHREQFEDKRNRMLRKRNQQYKYPDRLVREVEKHGFWLPKSKKDMITRGLEHNNCVANYHEIHIRPVNNGRKTIIIMGDDCTVELECEITHGYIVSTTVIQCKGKFNHDAIQSYQLARLRIDLVGRVEETLIIGVKDVSE
jgi:hypothetical protein